MYRLMVCSFGWLHVYPSDRVRFYWLHSRVFPVVPFLFNRHPDGGNFVSLVNFCFHFLDFLSANLKRSARRRTTASVRMITSTSLFSRRRRIVYLGPSVLCLSMFVFGCGLGGVDGVFWVENTFRWARAKDKRTAGRGWRVTATSA